MSNNSANLPDINICRAEGIGHSKYAACLVERSFQCPYVLLYAADHYCYHPNRETIIDNTNQHSKNTQV